MKAKTFDAIRRLRNESRHGAVPRDAAALAERLSTLDLPISKAQLLELSPSFLRILGAESGIYYVPPIVLQMLGYMLEGQSGTVCDPWAGTGEVLAGASEAVRTTKALAFTQDEALATLGRVLVPAAVWEVGNPLDLLGSLSTNLDVAVGVLPFGARSSNSLELSELNGGCVELRDDLGNLLLAASAARLSPNGIGLFITTASFFLSHRSVFRKFDKLGLGIEAALALPSGSFAPYTNTASYLVVARRHVVQRMFVAQLSNDPNINLQIVSNFKEGKEGGVLDLGRFVDPLSFAGLDPMRVAERLEVTQRKFGADAHQLGELATVINLGRSENGFTFPSLGNAVFVPMTGGRDVVASVDDFIMKPHNYAQVGIDPSRSDARFIAQFLNSELGKEIREANKSGFIRKLNKQSLRSLPVLVPDVQMQKMMLDIESRISIEYHTLVGLEIELDEFRRELWSNPQSASDVDRYVTDLSARLSGELKQREIASVDHWVETLPFPMASILRAWQATPRREFKTKQEHLLRFFEGTAEFVCVILLSAFSANEALFASHRAKLSESLQTQHLSFQRATFGTWRLAVEYLGKQLRQLLKEDGKNPDDVRNDRALCAEIFCDPSLTLPKALSQKELVGILSRTNKMRNDWSGHGGVVGEDEAQIRNERLYGEVQKLREVMADTWTRNQLVRLVRGDLTRGLWANELAVLTGSNTPFLTETRSMSMPLEKDDLYIAPRESPARALRLLPLVQVGRSPDSAKNACYFFSRLEPDGARFVSYHFVEKPELRGQFDEARALIEALSHG